MSNKAKWYKVKPTNEEVKEVGKAFLISLVYTLVSLFALGILIQMGTLMVDTWYAPANAIIGIAMSALIFVAIIILILGIYSIVASAYYVVKTLIQLICTSGDEDEDNTNTNKENTSENNDK